MARPLDCGSADVYCPEGSSSPTSVDSGYYSTPEADSETTRTSRTERAGTGVFTQNSQQHVNDVQTGAATTSSATVC